MLPKFKSTPSSLKNEERKAKSLQSECQFDLVSALRSRLHVMLNINKTSILVQEHYFHNRDNRFAFAILTASLALSLAKYGLS